MGVSGFAHCLISPRPHATAISSEWRMTMTPNSEDQRFRAGAEKYASYLATREGRLRMDLTFLNLQEFLPAENRGSLRALDVGCGTGAMAVRLAQLGLHVTVVDSSFEMLEIAEGAVRKAGLEEKVVFENSTAEELGNSFVAGSFGVILCHNLLEYVDDPTSVLAGIASLMRDSSAIVSVLVRNQAGEVFKAALGAGDLAAAENNLGAAWGQESLYGGRVRLFTPDGLKTMLQQASLTVIAMRGVRVIADYLGPATSCASQYQQVLELESKLGARPEFAAVARYTHCLARRTSQPIDGGR
jgi:S-adenosylmethionine-dependent methyltransferase